MATPGLSRTPSRRTGFGVAASIGRASDGIRLQGHPEHGFRFPGDPDGYDGRVDVLRREAEVVEANLNQVLPNQRNGVDIRSRDRRVANHDFSVSGVVLVSLVTRKPAKQLIEKFFKTD